MSQSSQATRPDLMEKIHYEVMRGNVKALQNLCSRENDALINVINDKRDDGRTVLYLAIEKLISTNGKQEQINQAEIVTLLLRTNASILGVSQSADNKRGDDPMYIFMLRDINVRYDRIVRSFMNYADQMGLFEQLSAFLDRSVTGQELAGRVSVLSGINSVRTKEICEEARILLMNGAMDVVDWAINERESNSEISDVGINFLYKIIYDNLQNAKNSVSMAGNEELRSRITDIAMRTGNANVQNGRELSNEEKMARKAERERERGEEEKKKQEDRAAREEEKHRKEAEKKQKDEARERAREAKDREIAESAEAERQKKEQEEKGAKSSPEGLTAYILNPGEEINVARLKNFFLWQKDAWEAESKNIGQDATSNDMQIWSSRISDNVLTKYTDQQRRKNVLVDFSVIEMVIKNNLSDIDFVSHHIGLAFANANSEAAFSSLFKSLANHYKAEPYEDNQEAAALLKKMCNIAVEFCEKKSGEYESDKDHLKAIGAFAHYILNESKLDLTQEQQGILGVVISKKPPSKNKSAEAVAPSPAPLLKKKDKEKNPENLKIIQQYELQNLVDEDDQRVVGETKGEERVLFEAYVRAISDYSGLEGLVSLLYELEAISPKEMPQKTDPEFARKSKEIKEAATEVGKKVGLVTATAVGLMQNYQSQKSDKSEEKNGAAKILTILSYAEQTSFSPFKNAHLTIAKCHLENGAIQEAIFHLAYILCSSQETTPDLFDSKSVNEFLETKLGGGEFLGDEKNQNLKPVISAFLFCCKGLNRNISDENIALAKSYGDIDVSCFDGAENKDKSKNKSKSQSVKQQQNQQPQVANNNQPNQQAQLLKIPRSNIYFKVSDDLKLDDEAKKTLENVVAQNGFVAPRGRQGIVSTGQYLNDGTKVRKLKILGAHGKGDIRVLGYETADELGRRVVVFDKEITTHSRYQDTLGNYIANKNAAIVSLASRGGSSQRQ